FSPAHLFLLPGADIPKPGALASGCAGKRGDIIPRLLDHRLSLARLGRCARRRGDWRLSAAVSRTSTQRRHYSMSTTFWIIVAGAVLTYLTRIGGYLVISRFDRIHPRVEAG